jgi:hypothetical protein
VYASPVTTGCGVITIEHGLVPVPAPATAWLLRGMPLRESTVECELTTPTGAAILAELGARFTGIPAMQLHAVGHGAGTRELPGQANLLRVLLGHPVGDGGNGSAVETETVLVLATNLDDATGEELGLVQQQLLAMPGVLDVFMQPVQMKKNRPGVELTVLCALEARSAVEQLVFALTPTLGIRCCRAERHVLRREIVEVETGFGPVRGKLRRLPDGTETFKPEADDCQRIATARSMPFAAVVSAVNRAWASRQQ